MKPSLIDFIASLNDSASKNAYKTAIKREQGIPIYDGDNLREMDRDGLNAVKQEWAECWSVGAGIIIIQDFYSDKTTVDAMSEVMHTILENEQRENNQIGDHFAKQGANSRIWNVLEKSAIEDPNTFIQYYSNPLLGVVSEAWLGPCYKMTAQVNLVPPGGAAAQDPHRDYHLGFQADDEIAKFPLHAQAMSSMLTLQGAIAHIDMPVESGPTKFLPYSQQYNLGYQIYRLDKFKTYFEENTVQLPLKNGDAVFFNPALMHGAGSNISKDVQRLVNLLQVSSPFGVSMEKIDHDRIQIACFDTLSATTPKGDELDTLLTIMSDSYPFPTNLDRDAPEDSLTPTSSKQLLQRALNEKLNRTQYEALLKDYRWRRSTS